MNANQLKILVENLQLISMRLLNVQLKDPFKDMDTKIEIGLINKDLIEINDVLIDQLRKEAP